MKLFHIDLETTGTDPVINGIIQISGIIEIDGKEQKRFNSFVKPFPDDVIEDQALEKNGRTREEIATFPEPLTVYGEFKNLLNTYVDRFDRKDKMYHVGYSDEEQFQFAGYNSKFDDQFLRAWFEKCKDKFYGAYFFWPPIDVALMAAIHFMDKRKSFPDFKLMTVAEKAGIDISENRAHDAEFDIKITRELFYKLKNGGKRI